MFRLKDDIQSNLFFRMKPHRPSIPNWAIPEKQKHNWPSILPADNKHEIEGTDFTDRQNDRQFHKISGRLIFGNTELQAAIFSGSQDRYNFRNAKFQAYRIPCKQKFRQREFHA